MWARHLVFPAVLLVGGLAVIAALAPPPAAQGRRLTTSPVAPDFHDALQRVNEAFHQTWKEREVRPAPPADDLAVARRLALGLMGTTPSLEEIRQFEALPDHRVSIWLEALLSDTRFHAYFAERLARAYVGTEDGPFIVFRRRRFVTWLNEQLAANRPYDGVVRDLIASEGLWTDHPATNFVTVTIRQGQTDQPDPERLASRVSRAFLGLRLDCAQCHNHPFASWKQRDFQGLAAFFGPTTQLSN